MINENDNYEFSEESFGSFYYTTDKKIKSMDDSFIISKIIEKYPELNNETSENVLKNVILCIFDDSKLIKETMSFFDINVYEIFEIIYRRFSFIFNTCLVKKLHETLKGKTYARKNSRKRKLSSRRHHKNV